MQKALFVEKVGEPVRLGTKPIPKPKQGQVLIKVESTMINGKIVLPHDTYGRDTGLFIGDKLPGILGTNLGGVVQEVGSPDSPYRAGDRVFGEASVSYPTSDMAGLQEYALLDVQHGLAKVPDSFTVDELVSLPVNAVTSFLALFHPTGLGFAAPFPTTTTTDQEHDASRQNIVIIGAGSQVGKLAIQFAKLAGIGTIIAVAAGSRTTELRNIGATHVLDRHTPVADLVAQVHDVVGGEENVTRIFDCANWTHELATALAAPKGASKLRTLHPVDTDGGVNNKELRPSLDAAYVVGTTEALEPLSKDFWRFLPEWVTEGHLTIPPFRVIEGLDAEKVNAALDGYQSGKSVLQVVIHPSGGT
ncbi:MAG: hypothetical protein Q9195_006328 [Heterodermia aff. obscurata]